MVTIKNLSENSHGELPCKSEVVVPQVMIKSLEVSNSNSRGDTPRSDKIWSRRHLIHKTSVRFSGLSRKICCDNKEVITHTHDLRNVASPGDCRFGVKANCNKILEAYPRPRVAHICYRAIFKRDLTRYGIEANPGPLDAILEDRPYDLNHTEGIFVHCYQCDDEYLLSSCNNCVIFTALCKQCEKNIHFLQADIFSSESVADVNSRFNVISDWIYNGTKHGVPFLSHYFAIPYAIQKHVSLIEDALILMHHMLLGGNTMNRYIAIANFCKLRGSRISFTTTLGYIVGDICSVYLADEGKYSKIEKEMSREVIRNMPFERQADVDSMYEGISSFRQYLGMYDKIKESLLYKKCYKMLLYIMAVGLLDNTKINFESLNFSKFERDAIERTHKPGFDMFHCILDTVSFICERGMYYFKTGDMLTIFHSGGSYEAWMKTALRLIKESKLLLNPEPHGISKFKFHSELLDTIEKGKGISRFTTNLEKFEKMTIQKTLFDLQMIEANEITKKSAQKVRKDPFAVLIHGSSSIAKSQLTQILFYHYGKIFGLPTGDEYRYTRCPTDEYWSGFNSTQWCIVMDDIAFLKPNNEVDPTLKEMLQVKNSVPYTPPQAALEDKGRTPVKAELVIGTTNTKDLNLHAYFACPFAIARRLSYVISAHVKKEYTKHNFMADSQKIPITEDGEYMNIWRFDVSIPVPELDTEVDSQRTKYKVVQVFEDINDLLEWYITVAKEHEIAQGKAMAAVDIMSSVEICHTCYRTIKSCKCHGLQSESVEDSDEELYTGLDDEDYVRAQQRVSMDTHTIDEETNNGDSIVISQEQQIQELIKDMSVFFKIQLWFITKIIEHDLNPNVLYYLYEDYFSQYLRVCQLIILFSLYVMYLFEVKLVSLVIFSVLVFIYLFYLYFWVIIAHLYMYRWGMCWKYGLAKSVLPRNVDSLVFILRLAGQRVKSNFGGKRALLILSTFVGTISALSIVNSCFKYYTDKKFNCKKAKDYVTVVEAKYNNIKTKMEKGYTTQSHGVVPVALEKEKPVFYYNDPYKISDVELSGQSKCAQGNSLRNKLAFNSARFVFHEVGRKVSTTAVNIKGNIWLINKHSLLSPEGTIDVIFEDVEQNVSRNVRNLQYTAGDVKGIKDCDVCFIQIKSIPPGANLVPYLPLELLRGAFKGEYCMVSKSGIGSWCSLSDIHYGRSPIDGSPGYFAKSDILTQKGDCGSMCIAQIGTAQVLLGIHGSGNMGGGVFMHTITQGMMNDILKKFEPQVDMGTMPISAGMCKRTLGPMHAKSPLRWLPEGTAHIMGSFEGYRPKHKSKVKRSYIADFVEDEYPNKFAAPDMSWKPWHLAIKDMTTPMLSVDSKRIKECEDAFYNDLEHLLGDKISQLEVYTQDVALNGVPGVTYVDRINVSTSAGNPFKKSKKHFLTMDSTGYITNIDQVMQDRINDIEELYKKGIRFNPQFCAHLKDEPTALHKVEAGKTRVFTGSEFAWSIVVRKYYLSHIRLIQNNPFIFEAMPGIVAQSVEWKKLHDYITEFGSDRMIAGDYAKFDKKMTAAFILSAFGILIRLSEKAGWSDGDLLALRCIAIDTAFYNVDFNGDYIAIQGNPSGHPLTVIINCLVNSLYMRFAFMICSGKPVSDFKKYVRLATYGDDNVMGVSKECPNFNHTRIAISLKIIGVEYTMADKEAESIPYISIKDVSFLKRAFVYDPSCDIMLAPLEHKSFDKMLTTHLDNGILAAEAHSICVIETALREYFFYGREKFEERRIYFLQIIEKAGLSNWLRDPLPIYDQLLSDYRERSANLLTA